MGPQPEVILKGQVPTRPVGGQGGVESGPSSLAGQRTHRIVVVGGGAGGLELVTRLGDRLGRQGGAHVTLIDVSRTHVWKPLLHEFAAGTLRIHDHALHYIAHARWHHLILRLGALEGLDRAHRQVIIAPSYNAEGEEVIPRRRISYH